MKKYVYLAVFWSMTLWLLGLGACQEPRPEEGSLRAEDRVEWEMVLGDPASRAVVDSDGSGRFETGDTVVLYARNVADGSLRALTLRLADGRWEPEVSWSELGEEVEFTAWHLAPTRELHLAAQQSPDFLHRLAVDQQGSGYDRTDLLQAQTRARAGEPVRLLFGHALSRLHIVLESSDGSWPEALLQEAEVEVRTPGQLRVNLSEGSLQPAADLQWITPAKGADHTRTVLLCPQPAEEMPADGWIRIRIDDRETTVALPATIDGEPFGGLTAGCELTYRINLRKADRPDAYAGTTRWVYGLREPSDDQWNYDRTQLAWQPGCGWFDCNKVDPSDVTSGGDGLMCWAAAVSNLIHWWLDQNRTTAAVGAYTGPAAQPADMLHSEVFQLFKNRFPNQGDYPLKGINWFFNGVFHKKIYDTDPIDPAAGFFRGSLGTRTLGAEYVGTEMKRDRFNALVRQALASQQGILFVVNMGRAWTTHAVTLWGVKFDDEGLIETLYMVDNNDGRSDARGTIRTMEVRYLPYSETNPDLYPYVPNSVGDFTMRIESLCTLSLGREWIQ